MLFSLIFKTICFLSYTTSQGRKYGCPVESDELFMATHKNKKGLWIDTRSRETYVSLILKFSFIHS